MLKVFIVNNLGEEASNILNASFEENSGLEVEVEEDLDLDQLQLFDVDIKAIAAVCSLVVALINTIYNVHRNRKKDKLELGIKDKINGEFVKQNSTTLCLKEVNEVSEAQYEVKVSSSDNLTNVDIVIDRVNNETVKIKIHSS
jgi:hypothetical protein